MINCILYSMKHICILLFGLMFIASSCSTETTQEETAFDQKIDSAVTVTPAGEDKKSYNYRNRVVAFRVLPDKTIEEQVKKYEAFAPLFIEYQSIKDNKEDYSAEERENNKQGYMMLTDELVSLKGKLVKNMSTINKEQEQRLDAADAAMNKELPNVYKEDLVQ